MSQKELDFIKNVFGSQYFDQNLHLDYFVEQGSEDTKDGSFIISVIDERDFPPTINYSRYKLSAKALPVKSKIETLKVNDTGVAYVEYDATLYMLHVYYQQKSPITIAGITPFWFNSLKFNALKSDNDVVDLIHRATHLYKWYPKNEIKIETS